MKTELSKTINPLDQGRITETELTPLTVRDHLVGLYEQGYNHGLEIALMAKSLGLSDEEIIKRYKK